MGDRLTSNTAVAQDASAILAQPAPPTAADLVRAEPLAEREWEPRVLVVDDDPVCLLAAQTMLQRLGLTVDVAADGSEAVRLSGGWPYVAIFMDCYMPELDGFETTRDIRTREGLSQSPLVIAVTSRSRHVCLASGMDHHISKPLRLDALEADCRRLGLLTRTRPPVAATADPAALQACSTVPALIAKPGLTENRTAELAAGFVRRALLQLPRLWRAVNCDDTGSAQRIVSDVRQQANGVGAARVAALCDTLAEAAGRRRAEVVAALEPEIRRALRETAAAAHAQLQTPEQAAVADPAGAPARAVRVAIADDDPLARLAIETMIQRGDRLELVGSAADVGEIIELVRQSHPDVAVVDFMMPGGGGAEAARQIRERSPDTRVVALTASDAPDAYLAMLRAGAAGLLVKGSPPEKLVAMIHRAAEQPV
jgi:CheY-like chemotaxis protein